MQPLDDARPAPAGPTPGSSAGNVRAAVFGINDGVLSNTSLLVGMLGSGQEPRVALVAGTAGLMAGAVSMAAGEYVSMQSQRELLAHRGEGAGIAALGSPLGAAVTSFATFAMGAAVPLQPLLWHLHAHVLGLTAGLSGAALFAVGAFIARASGRSAAWGGLRMSTLGAVAGSATFCVGRLLGAAPP